MVTPFDYDLTVDYSEARKLARYLVESGSDGLVVAGTTGESPTLSWEEKVELFRVVVRRWRESCGACRYGQQFTPESIELTGQKVRLTDLRFALTTINPPRKEFSSILK